MNKLTRLTALLLAMLMIFSTVATAETAYQVGGMTVDNWQSVVDSAEEKLFAIDEGDSGKEVTPPPVVTPAPGAYYPYTDGTTTALAVNAEDATTQMTASGVAVLQNAEAGQWQMQIDDEWIGITGANGSDLWVTAAMMNGMSAANFRKALEPKAADSGVYTIFTNTVTVEIVAEVSGAMFMMARDGEVEVTPEPTPVVAANDVMTLEEANEDLEKYLVTIEYRFQKNEATAANPWYAQVGNNNPNLNRTVAYPTVVGYKPAANVKAFADGEEIDLPEDQFAHSAANKNMTINAVINSDLTIVVYYEPDQVPYTVKYYQEKISYPAGAQTEERYDEIVADRITQSGLTESTIAQDIVADNSNNKPTDENGVQYYAPTDKYTGFLPLLYDDGQEIAAAGDTEVKVRYQRLYYLLSFKLNGGIGFDPVYDKYGAETGLQTRPAPTRQGYTFAGWATSPDQTTNLIQIADLPSTVPATNQHYYAVWTPATTTYSIVHWFENVDSTDSNNRDNYTIVRVESDITGPTEGYINSNDMVKLQDNIAGMAEQPVHFTRTMLTANDPDYRVQLKGDGTSTVNVYYTRKSYTVRFYYAATDNQGDVYIITSADYNAATNNQKWILNSKVWAEIDPSGNANTTKNRPTIDQEFRALVEREGCSFDSHAFTNNSGQSLTLFYYDLTAKYNAPIAHLWPDFMIDYDSATDSDQQNTTYHGNILNSWAMHTGTPMFDKVADKSQITFKGTYSYMDADLIVKAGYDDANLGNRKEGLINYFTAYWRTPSRYFNYWVYAEAIEGVEYPDNVKRTYGGKTYVLYEPEPILATSGSQANNQKAPGYAGLTNVATQYEGNASSNGSENINNPYDIWFYYERAKVKLHYDYGYTNSNGVPQTHTVQNIAFGTPMWMFDYENPNATKGHIPPAPNDHYVFGGWYTDPTCLPNTKYDFANSTMPLADVYLYAKWEPVKYTVTVYNTPEDAASGAQPLYTPWQVAYGSVTTSAFTYDKPENFDPESQEFVKPSNGDWQFVGWFYVNDEGNEVGFSFLETPITRDTVVYAKWQANKVVPYTVYYVVDDGKTGEVASDYYTNENNWVAAPMVDSGLAGTDYTVFALGGSDLYSAQDSPAGVNYQEGYFPWVESQDIYLDLDETKNVVVFEYKPADFMPYTVKYLEVGTNKALAPEKVVDDNRKAIVTENYVPVAGNYVPDAFQKRLVFTADSTENVIIFWYTKDESRTTLTVNHYTIDYGTTTAKLYASTQDIVTLPYDVNVTPLEIENYLYDKEQTTRSDGGAAAYHTTELQFKLQQGAEGVVLNLYYVEQPLTIKYQVAAGCETMGTVTRAEETMGSVTGTVQGSTAEAKQNYKFVGWYSDEACTELVSPAEEFIPEKKEATYYAKFELDVAALTIKKEVKAATNMAAPAGDRFTIYVDFEFADGAAKPSTYTLNGVEQNIAWEGNKAVFTDIKADDEIVIKNVVIGTKYTVSEADHLNYTETIAPSVQTEIAASGNMVQVTNQYLTGELTIKKNLTSGSTPEDESFVFHVTGPDGYDGYVSIKGGNSVTLTNLKLGTYNVTETSWSYRYTPQGYTSASAVLSQTKLKDTVEFTNAEKPEKWLHDEYSVHNDFSKDVTMVPQTKEDEQR